MLNRETEILLTIVIFLMFICGGVVYIIKFYLDSAPNFYALTALLLGFLILILFYDKIESLEFNKFKFNMAKKKGVKEEFNKAWEEKYMKELTEKRYDISVKHVKVGDNF